MNIDDVELALEVIKERLSELENGDIKVVETCDPTINERYIASQKLLDSCNKLYNKMSDVHALLSYRISTINDSQKEIKKMLKEPPRNPRGLAPRMNWQNNFRNHSTNSKYDSIL